jgi:glycosyltransferase involved in cell wall biosynthesis
MRKPTVSVIMSVYNDEKYLNEAIESILRQTLHDFEFIIVDDGSTDSSTKIIENYSDSRIHIVRNNSNVGLTKSLNKAIKFATGNYIARQDSDDISMHNRLEKQVVDLEKNKSFLSVTGIINIFDDTKMTFPYIPPQDKELFNKMIVNKNIITHSTIMFRNSAGVFYREKFYFAQDYDLYLRMISEGKKISILPECLVKYRKSRKNISVKQRVYQYLFKQKAKELFDERMTSRKDSYDLFNPEEIFSTNISESINAELLKEKMDADFISGNFKELQAIYKKYYNLKKIDKYIILYFASCLPYVFVSFINKLMLKIKYR